MLSVPTSEANPRSSRADNNHKSSQVAAATISLPSSTQGAATLNGSCNNSKINPNVTQRINRLPRSKRNSNPSMEMRQPSWILSREKRQTMNMDIDTPTTSQKKIQEAKAARVAKSGSGKKNKNVIVSSHTDSEEDTIMTTGDTKIGDRLNKKERSRKEASNIAVDQQDLNKQRDQRNPNKRTSNINQPRSHNCDVRGRNINKQNSANATDRGRSVNRQETSNVRERSKSVSRRDEQRHNGSTSKSKTERRTMVDTAKTRLTRRDLQQSPERKIEPAEEDQCHHQRQSRRQRLPRRPVQNAE